MSNSMIPPSDLAPFYPSADLLKLSDKADALSALAVLLPDAKRKRPEVQALRALPDLFWTECERSHNLQTAA